MSRVRMSRACRRATVILVAVAVMTLGITACGSAGEAGRSDGDASTRDQPLVVLNSYEIAALDPVGSGGFWLYDFGAQENLLQRGDDGSLRPWLATRVDQVDATTWRATLRPDVKFGNGKILTASAFAAAFNRQMSKRASSRTLVTGALAKAVGDLEVHILTPTPNAAVPNALAERGAFPAYDVEVVEAAGGDNARLLGGGWLTGPYQPTAWSPTELTLSRFANYWRGTPPLPAVVIKRVLDEQARMLAVRNGEADLNLYPPIEAKRLLKNSGEAFFKTSSIGLQGVTMDLNLTSAPFDDVSVRRAFALAIDYEVLAEDVLDGVFDAATGLYPSKMVSGAAKNARTDAAEAKRLLDTAGWNAGSGGVRSKAGRPLTVKLLRAAQDPETNSLAVALQAMLKPIGFDVHLVTSEDFFTVLKDMEAWDATLFLTGLLSSTASPYGPFFNKLVTGGTNNNGRIADPNLDQIGKQLVATFDGKERLRLLNRADEIVIREQAYLVTAAFKRYPVVVSPAYRDYTVSNFRRHVTFDTSPAR